VFANCDIVIHSAAAVSFDAPLDTAVEVNLLGPARVATALRDAHRERATPLPHLISVSTAYVNSGHKGDAYEQAITESPYLALPAWRSEVAASRRAARRGYPEPGSEATSRAQTRCKGRTRCRRHCAVGRTHRTASGRVDRRTTGRARPLPRPRTRMAGRVRTHEVPRRSRAPRRSGRSPRVSRTSFHRRVGTV